MTKLWLFVFLGSALPTHPPIIASSHGTLFFVGTTPTSIVIAADGHVTLKTNGPVASRQDDKLMPLGNTGTCFIGGYSTIGDVGEPDKVELEKTVRDWIKANPTATLPNAHEAISNKILDLMKAYRHKHPDLKPIEELSYLMCVGYYMGWQQFYTSLYAVTPNDVTSRPDNPPIPPGHFRTFGWSKVCTEITEGNATTKFTLPKSDPAVVKYRKAVASNNFRSISRQDLLRLSRLCLEATESAEGRAFDPNAKGVGPPNRYAVIDERQGFRWVGRP